MVAAVLYEDFRGTGALVGTSPATLTNAGSASWVSASSTGFVGGQLQRSADGALFVMPASGQSTSARLNTDYTVLAHSSGGGGVTVVECSTRPGAFVLLSADFEDMSLFMTCSAAGAYLFSVDGSSSSGTIAARGAAVTYRMEITTAAVRFYIDGALIYTAGIGLANGTNIVYAMVGFNGVAGTPGYASGSSQLAVGYLHLKTEVSSGALGGAGLASADTTAPAFTGAVAVIFPTANSFTASWPAATDAAGVTSYEYSLNGGAYISNGTSRAVTLGPIPTGVTTLFSVRALDAAGNPSAALASTIYTPLVALQVGVPPAPFPLGTEWAVNQFARRGSLTIAGRGSGYAIGVSGDGNTAAVLLSGYVGDGSGDPLPFTIQIYVRSGGTFILVAEPLSPFVWDLNSNLTASLDWSGTRLAVLSGSRPELVDSRPETRNRCLTFGLSVGGWVLIADQQFVGHRLFSGAVVSADGLRLVAPVGRVSEANGAVVYAWDSTAWRENEVYAHSGLTDGRRVAMGDSATIFTNDTVRNTYFEAPLTTGVRTASIAQPTDAYVALTDFFPMFRNLGVVVRFVKQQSGTISGNALYELRKTEAGWRRVGSTSRLLVAGREFFNGALAMSEDGTCLHDLSIGGSSAVWTWYERDVAITRLPPGYTPSLDPGYDPADPERPPLPPLGPDNEPGQNTSPYANFWTAFNATYEVP